MTGAEMTDPEPEELADRAAPLDALLVDAALGPMRRLAPNASTVRFAARLARHPRSDRPPAGRPGRRAGPGRRRHLDHRAVQAGPPVRRPGVVARTRCCAALVQGYLATSRAAERAGRRRGAGLARRPAGALPGGEPGRGAVAEQRPAGEPRVGEGGHRHRRRSLARGGLNFLRDMASAAADPGDGGHVAVRGRPHRGGHARRGGAADRGPGADPVPATDRAGPGDPAADRAADHQQVLRPRPGTWAEPDRVPGAGRPAGVRDLVAQPGRPACRLGPGHVRAGGARRARRGRAHLPHRPDGADAGSAPAASSPASPPPTWRATGQQDRLAAFAPGGHGARQRPGRAPPPRWPTGGWPRRRPRCRGAAATWTGGRWPRCSPGCAPAT